jgi:hypothetical protein
MNNLLKINPPVKLTRTGFGSDLPKDNDEVTTKKVIKWKKTVQRFEQTKTVVNLLDPESP